RDRLQSKWSRFYCSVALFAALSFHVGAEILELRIGWFSYYMIFAALVFFLPESWLRAAGSLVSLPARRFARQARPNTSEREERNLRLFLSAAAGILVLVTGHFVDLPGATVASGIFGFGVLVSTFWDEYYNRFHASRIIASLAAAGLMWFSISVSQ